jgi:hypothetical protein
MNSGTVTVGTSPTLICAQGYENHGAIVQNTGDTPVFLGAESVAASGTAAGLSLAAGATLTIPLAGQLFAVAASDTGGTVAFIAGGGTA